MQPYLETILATLIWGFGFVAAKWALEGAGPLWQTAIRFGFAFIALDLFFRAQGKSSTHLRYRLQEFKRVFPLGVCLFGLIGAQTWGLQYTSATKSGFITVLYVLFVPLFQRVFQGVRINRLILLWISIALLGTTLICGVITRQGVSAEWLSAFNQGDLLTLVCAMFAAGHILVTNRIVKSIDSSVRLHIYQCAWVALMATVSALLFEGSAGFFLPWSAHAWIGMLQLGMLSTAVAFLIQIRVQRHIPPATLGLILLMESPWAMFFSVSFTHEILTSFQIAGAGLILLAAAAESWCAYRR